MKKKFLLLICFFYALYSVAQEQFTDSVFPLRPVEVIASKSSYLSNFKNSIKIDSAILNTSITGNLAQLLMHNLALYTKAVGVGGLTTLSVRGGGASHTAVVWNNVKIQNTMNGSTDLSQIPVVFADEVWVQTNGGSSLYGSGATNGVINLKSGNLINKPTELTAGLSAASYNNYSMYLKLHVSNQFHGFMIKYLYSEGLNDFKFKNIAMFGAPVQKQTNAYILQNSFLTESQHLVSKHSKITTSIWLNNRNYGIPTLMTDSKPSVAQEQDQSLIAGINYFTGREKYTVNTNVSVVHNSYVYQNKSVDSLVSENISQQFISETQFNYRINSNLSVLQALHFSINSAQSEMYFQMRNRNLLTYFTALQHQLFKQRIKLTGSIRAEYVNFNVLIPTYSADVSLKISNNLTAGFISSKNFKLPLLNDLYWYQKGMAEGNPLLLSEKGVMHEIYFSQSKYNNTFQYQLSQTLFYSKTRGLIVWSQRNGIWSPFNVANALSGGMELKNQLSWRNRKSEFVVLANYNYVKVTYADGLFNASDIVLYKPRHMANGSIKYSYNNFGVFFSTYYTGKQYFDYKNYINPTVISNMQINVNLKLRNYGIFVIVMINNVFNTHYRATSWYAMPMRNYGLQLRINSFLSSNNKLK